MKISDEEYKGYNYSIHLNKGDRRLETNKFRIEGYGFLNGLGYEKAFEDIKRKAEEAIDNRIDNKIENIYEELKLCMVWTGYEDCHLDETMVNDILLKYKKQILSEK